MSKAIIVTAPEMFQKPENLEKYSIFLAGSIDNGFAQDWQKNAIQQLSNENVLLLNPRRSNWNSNAGSDEVREQINWELDALDYVDMIIMYIAENSKAPISLLEMGLNAKESKILVSVHPSFYRRINVEEVCKRYNIPLYETLEELIEAVREKIPSN